MSNAILAAIILPVVVALAPWIMMVYRTDRHPGFAGSRHGKPLSEVTGGSFRGRGGR